MSVTEEIKARLDIVNFISQYVPLKKSGRNFIAPCPFHAERTPSFVVFPESQNWRCFGACGEGGDIFNFIMKRDGLDFPTALGLLAEKAGVQLQQRTPEQTSQDERLDKLRGLVEETARFYHDKLMNSAEAEHARAYVRKRGLSESTIVQFGIGFAPKDWHQALDHLLLLGYQEQDLLDAGLVIKNEQGRVYDRFRNRLMIPIFDARGRAIGFGARALAPDDNPKYLNSPQTALFDKGATLFALHLARRAIREGETAVIVEGYMDAIQAHQGGFSNVVAQMGTALTESQLRQLSRYARRLILALDPDVAGAKATMRGLNVVREASGSAETFFDAAAVMRHAGTLELDLRVVTLPGSQDPDDLIRENPEGWRRLIAAAQPVAEYVIEVGTADVTPQTPAAEREGVARQLLPILLATESDLQRHVNIQQLALRLRLNEKTLMIWAQQHRQAATRRPRRTEPQSQIPASPTAQNAYAPQDGYESSATSPQPQSLTPIRVERGAALERYCLGLLMHYPDWLAVADRKLREVMTSGTSNGTNLARTLPIPLSAQDFTLPEFRVIMDMLHEALDQDEQEPVEFLWQKLPEELRAEIEELLVDRLANYAQLLDERKESRMLRGELGSIIREQQKTGMKSSQMLGMTEEQVLQRELERQVLELRKARLERENLELQFLQQDADPDLQVQYGKLVQVNRQALDLIGKALGQAAKLQR